MSKKVVRFNGKKLELTEKEWKKRLTPKQFNVLRNKGTETAFSNKYNEWDKEGIFVCAGCGLPLFKTDAKFNSGTGWPSFFEPIDPKNVEFKEDPGIFSTRVEVVCARCGGHLGHVFDDGPQPTGKRYCMNSEALKFE